MVRIKKWVFLGLKSRFLAEKSDFCHTTSIFVNGLFVALGEKVFYLDIDFLTFRSGVMAVFVKKDPADAPKSLPPPHCGGTVCQ